MKPDRHYSDVVVFLRLLRQARQFWPYIAALLVLGLASAPIALLAPLPLKLVVDSVLGDHALPSILAPFVPSGVAASPAGVLGVAILLVLLIPVIGQLVELSRSVLRTHTGDQLVLSFRSLLLRHVQRLSMSHHDAKGSADAVFRIMWDAPAIQHVVIDLVINLLSATVTLIAMLYVMARIDAQLALVAVAVTPILAGLTFWFRSRMRPGYRQLKQLEGAAHSVLQESLGALRVVKAFGQEEREEQRFLAQSTAGMKARLRLSLAEGRYNLLVAMTTALGTAVVLLLGVRHVWSGLLTLGDLILVMSYLAQLYTPLQTMARTASSLQPSLAGAERVFALLDQTPDVVELPNARPLKRAVGAIAFRNVSFEYHSDRRVLENITLDIAPGTRVGIRGATGAGKTTLLSLLTRFYDPIEGQILLDGVDLRHYRLTDLRSQFSLVLQEPVLFSASIAENISYARPEANEGEIVDAAMAARAHDFISTLPNGYDTQVGERGMQLSGGERQRISLARAFLKQAPILILDEPTSSVDFETERVIIEAMNRLMQGRTSFMIAHRLGTLDMCDVILHMESGRIIAGTGRNPSVPVGAR